jgi:acetylornithine deacetylase/succinyl-diaminopimelate desuccinylase-like protein
MATKERAVEHRTAADSDILVERALKHLRALIRLDTSNPPGNETLAARYVASVVGAAGIAAEIVEPEPGRGSVAARLKADPAHGDPEPALLLHAHLDVVPARMQDGWTHDPFAADTADGFVWGRGAVDHKSAVATLLAAFVALGESGLPLRRDVVLAATADEEAGGFLGTGWLVEHRPELLDAAYCLGEGGGYRTRVAGRYVYPCAVAEKGICQVRLRARGPTGHGSIPLAANAILTLSDALARLRQPLPIHIVEPVKRYLRGVAAQPASDDNDTSALLAALAGAGDDGEAASAALRQLAALGLEREIGPMLRNTATPTLLEAGVRDNVIPPEALATLDVRFLPGQTPESVAREIRAALGEKLGRQIEVEVDRSLPPVELPWNSPLADVLSEVLARHDPTVPLVPAMMVAGTDAKHLVKLPNLRHLYGFNPLWAPDGFALFDQLHAVDERVPVAGVAFGARVLADVLTEFCADR